MRPTEESGELFEAFSRINEKAYADPRLLANHVLSKTPHCNDVLARWLRGEKPRQPDTLETAFQIAKYYAINAAAFALHAAAGLMRKASGFSALPRVRELIRKSRAEGRVVTVTCLCLCVVWIPKADTRTRICRGCRKRLRRAAMRRLCWPGCTEAVIRGCSAGCFPY